MYTSDSTSSYNNNKLGLALVKRGKKNPPVLGNNITELESQISPQEAHAIVSPGSGLNEGVDAPTQAPMAVTARSTTSAQLSKLAVKSLST